MKGEPMTTQIKTYRLQGDAEGRADLLSELERRVARMAKTCAKNGLPAPAIVSTREVTERVSEGRAALIAFALAERGDDYRLEDDDAFIETHLAVTVENAVARIPGHRFIGKVCGETGVISLSPDAQADNIEETHRDSLGQFRSAPTRCQHCNAKRKRTFTVILEDETTGEWKQIGRSCLKKYTGFEPFSGMFSDEYLTDGLGGFDGAGFGRRVVGISARHLLFASACHIKQEGFLSRRKAREIGAEVTTADELRQWFALSTFGPTDKLEEHIVSESIEKETKLDWDVEQNRNLVTDILAFIKGMDAWGNEYKQNLKTLFYSDTDGVLTLRDSIDPKHFGLAVSSVSFYLRELGFRTAREEAAARKREGNFIGAVGDKFGRKLSSADRRNGVEAYDIIKATVTGLRFFENDWGVKVMIEMLDEHGDVFVWWAGRSHGVEIGDSVEVIGTLKAHKEYNGVKQNIITRCKISQVETEAVAV